jgi:hypothetical protein
MFPVPTKSVPAVTSPEASKLVNNKARLQSITTNPTTETTTSFVPEKTQMVENDTSGTTAGDNPKMSQLKATTKNPSQAHITSEQRSSQDPAGASTQPPLAAGPPFIQSSPNSTPHGALLSGQEGLPQLLPSFALTDISQQHATGTTGRKLITIPPKLFSPFPSQTTSTTTTIESKQFAFKSSSPSMTFLATKTSAKTIPDDSEDAVSAKDASSIEKKSSSHDQRRKRQKKGMNIFIEDSNDESSIESLPNSFKNNEEPPTEKEVNTSLQVSNAIIEEKMSDENDEGPFSIRQKLSEDAPSVASERRVQPRPNVRPKMKKGKRKRIIPASSVDFVAQWEFPSGSTDLWNLIRSSHKQGIDATIIQDTRKIIKATGLDTKEAKPAKKTKKNVNAVKSTIIPYVTDVEFNTTFLEYDDSPIGFLDQLGKKAPPSKQKPAIIPPNSALEKIPNEVDLGDSASRLGPKYQARVPVSTMSYMEKRGNSYLPDFDTLWDPYRADEAERNGENIEGFLNINCELIKKECLMMLLHLFDYDVARAEQEYNRICAFGGDPTSKLTRVQGATLENLLHHQKKDFVSLSEKMNRSKSDCMIHYYNWKRRSSDYRRLKGEWKSDYCAICDDGGDLLVCDGCERAYHPGCLEPPLKKIPEGDWFCPRCEDMKSDHNNITRSQPFSPLSPSLTTNNRMGTYDEESDSAPSSPQGRPKSLFTEQQNASDTLTKSPPNDKPRKSVVTDIEEANPTLPGDESLDLQRLSSKYSDLGVGDPNFSIVV